MHIGPPLRAAQQVDEGETAAQTTAETRWVCMSIPPWSTFSQQLDMVTWRLVGVRWLPTGPTLSITC